MSRRNRIIIRVLVTLLVLAGISAVAIPPLVRSQAVKAVQEKMGRTLVLQKISFNPFTGTLRLGGVSLSEKGESTVFASVEGVRVRISLKSFLHLAPVVGSVDVEKPYVHIVRTGPNRYNFSDMMSSKKKDTNEKPAKFSINNIRISGGSIDFTDRVTATEQQHQVRELLLQVPFVSTLPYLAERYIDPKFSAVIDGSPLELTGKMRPFAKEVEVSLMVKLQRLDLPKFAAYLPAELPIRLDKGSLTTDLELIHKTVQSGQPEFTIKGLVRLDDLAIAERGGKPLLNLDTAATNIAAAKLLSRDISFEGISSRGLELFIERDAKGVLNLQRLKGEPKEAAKEEEKPAKEPIKTVVTVAKLNLLDSRIHWQDQVPKGGFGTTVTDLDITGEGLSTAEGKEGSYGVSITTERGESISAKGTAVLSPLAVTSTVGATSLALEAYYPYLAGVLTAPVAGRMDLGSDLTFSTADGLKTSNGTLTARNLSIPFGPKDSARLPLLTVAGISLDLPARSAVVDRVDLQGGKVSISKEADGTISPLLLLAKHEQGEPPVATKKEPAAKPFGYRLNKVGVNGLDVAFTDNSRKGSPRFRLGRLGVSLEHIVGPKMETIPFNLRCAFNKNGSIKTSGTVLPAPFRLKGTATLHRIPLTDFDSYFPENLNVVVADGSLDTTLSFNLARKGEGMGGSFGGSVAVNDFYSVDGDRGDDLLKWESLHLDKMSGTLSPFSLKLAEVALSSFYARVEVNKDGTLNLQQAFRKPAAEPAATTATATTAAKQPSSPPASVPAATTPQEQVQAQAPKAITIDAVTMQDGTLSFADHHLKPEYATTMLNIGGRITGLSSAETTMADVDLRGNLENHSPLRITGRINPLRDDLFVDLKVNFTDIELAPVTPYSGTYLGYVIDKGKLFLDLKYHIEQKKLEASNTIFIDQFTFGRKVESDKATKLPVSLAVALLKDRKGEIHLDLPLTGRTDDPKFSIWRLVLQVLQNLLVKAATSPFALLGSLGGGEEFSAVVFSPGSSRLSAAEEAKLLKLGQALAERPALKMEVSGYVDKEKDPEGYRKELLLKKMRAEKFLALVKAKKVQPGQSADDLVIEPQEQNQLLKAVYLKEKFPKPRNFIGMVKDIPDEEMRKLIYANTIVGDQELRTLARERATAVRSFLISGAKMDPARVFEKSDDIAKKPEKDGAPASRAELGLATN